MYDANLGPCQCAAWTLGYERLPRLGGERPTEGEWNVDEASAGKIAPAASALTARHGGMFARNGTTVYVVPLLGVACDPASAAWGTSMGRRLDYGCENACREWGYPKEGEWNVDEDCCAGKKQMACADGYRLENTGNVCYDEDCTAYDYHCIACDPASACMGNLDEDGEDYDCDNVGLLILIICLPIGVVLICIGVGCCICHRRRQAQQRQAQAAANAQMAHVQMAPVPNAQMAHVQMAPVPKKSFQN